MSLQSFPPDYNRSLIILLERIDGNKNLGNWNPFRAPNFFFIKFHGIINIKPTGSKKIKIIFYLIINSTLYLNSIIPYENGFSVNILSTLIFSYEFIKLENTIFEEELWKDLQSPVPIDTFKRIPTKKDGCIITL